MTISGEFSGLILVKVNAQAKKKMCAFSLTKAWCAFSLTKKTERIYQS